MKSVLPKAAYGLLAILILAGILLTLGQRESKSRPSATSYNPSGLHAFLELLERNGIQTEVTRLEGPQLGKNDLAVAAYVEEGPTFIPSTKLDGVERALQKHSEGGGRTLVLPFNEDFRAASASASKSPTKVRSLDGDETLLVSSAALKNGGLTSYEESAYTVGAEFLSIESDISTYSPWFKFEGSPNEPFITYSLKGKGILVRTSDAMFATNRFLDRHDNAQLALRLVQGLLKPGGKVVFAEATLGAGIQPSLSSTLGPWAVGISAQLTFLFVLVVLALSVRFGLPQIEKRKQLGQREMIDAIADVYLRAKSTAVALDVAYQEADRRIRRGLKLPAHIGIAERDRLIPASLAKSLSDVDHLRKPIIQTSHKGKQKVTYRIDPSDALALIQKLEIELDAFVPKARNRLS